MNSKPNLRTEVWLLLEALCIMACTVKTSQYRWTFFIPIFIICTYALTCTMTDFKHLGLGERGMSSRLPMIVLFASTNILLCDPQKELRLIGQKVDISTAPFLSRLWWGLLLWTNPRGVNYAHEPRDLPPRPTQTTRTSFIIWQLRSMAWYFFVFDIVGIMNRANPHYTKFGPPVVEGWEHLWWFTGFGFGASIYALLSMEYKALTIILVLFGLSSPRDCPDYFGSPLDAYTIRRLWGKSWHQILRRGCVVHAKFVAKYLRLPPKSKTTTAVKLFVGFLISGIIHWISEAVVMQSLMESIGTLVFFLIQVVAIMGEEFVVERSHHFGFTKSTKWTKAVGFLWVFLWLNFSLPFWTVPGYKGGWTEELPDFSVIMGLWKGDWCPLNKPAALTS